MAFIIEEDIDWFEDDYNDERDFVDHSPAKIDYGVKRKSGRYPYGSGEIPYQHEAWFTWGSNDILANQVDDFKEHFKRQYGRTPTATEIVRGMDLKRADGTSWTRTDFDPAYSASRNERRMRMIAFVEKYRERYKKNNGRYPTNYQIEKYTKEHFGEKWRIPENTVTSLLNQQSKARTLAAQSTADFLEAQVKEKGMIDIGSDVELYIPGCSRTKLDTAIDILKQKGYIVYGRNIDQVTNPNSNNKTKIQVLCPPGTPKNILFTNLGDVKSIADYHAEVNENGETKFWKMEYPASLDSKRIAVRYGDKTYEDGYSGAEREGWIFIKRGCKDLDLGDSLYAQVRILVDDTHYIKGMASYYDGEFPPGCDLIFNTKHPSSYPLISSDPDANQLLKPIQHDDPINPFGALIKAGTGQYHYIDTDGKEKLGLINKKSEEGDWNDWKRTVSAQFTSKQNPKLIKSQIDISLADKRAEFEAIKQLENPVLKKNLLMKFAQGCDSDAVDLRTGPMPGQSFQVLVPIPTLGDKECYAPQYENGTKVAVIRYPHADISEIPILTVNNRNSEGLQLLGPQAKDCIGLSKAAEDQLSGADNDGDAAMVIPIREGGAKISAREPFKDMVGWDDQVAYPPLRNEKGEIVSNVLSKSYTQKQMGIVTNLIMDMDLQGAPEEDKVKAMKHSMVIIDAAKHKLNWKLSEAENDIAELKKKWQRHYDENGNLIKTGGASTLLTKAKSEAHVGKRYGQPNIDPETGKLIYKTLPDEKRFWYDKKGKAHEYTESVPLMSTVDNAYELLSNPDPKKAHPKELLYADYANALKALANEARKLGQYGLEEYSQSSEAAAKYADEVSSLYSKVVLSRRNAPRERMAQIQANAKKEALVEANPSLKGKDKETKKKLKKIRQQAIIETRSANNAKRVPIDVTEREWEAIQNHAVDKQTLELILKYADDKKIRQYATPKTDSRALTAAQQSRIKRYVASGWSYAEIAAQLGISKSSVEKYANGG